MYSFVWHELCDWYVEFVKPDLWGDNGEERKRLLRPILLVKVLRDSLKLLHPFMPFITEEIYSYLPGSKGFIMESGFPKEGTHIPKRRRKWITVMDVIKTIRNIRTEMNIHCPAQWSSALCFPSGKEAMDAVKEGEGYIKTLAKVQSLTMLEQGEKPENAAFSVVDANIMWAQQTIEVWIPLKGHIDAPSEIKRLSKDIDKISIANSRLWKKAFERSLHCQGSL